MKRTLTLIAVMLFFAFNLQSQERLTNLRTYGTLSKDFVKTIDSTNYLIRIYPNDEIIIYIVEAKGKLKKKSTKKIRGIYNMRINYIKNKYIVTELGNDSNRFFTIYNIVSDEIITLDDQNYSSYIRIKDDFAITLVKENTSSSYKKFIYNLKDKTEKILNSGEEYLTNFNNYFILKETDVSNRNIFYVYDFNTEQREIFLREEDSEYVLNPIFENDTLIYISSAGNIVKYDILNGTIIAKPLIQNSDKREFTLLANDSFYYVIEKLRKKLLMFKVDKRDNSIIANYKLSNLSNYNKFNLVKNKIICSGIISSATIVDVERNAKVVLSTSFNEDIEKHICGDYFIYQDFADLAILNLNDLTIKKIRTYDFPESLNCIGIENDLFLIACVQSPYYPKTLYYLDNKNDEVHYAYDLDVLSPGFDKTALLKMLKAKPLILGDDIYYYDDDVEQKVVKINTKPLYYHFFFENKFKLIDDRLYYLNEPEDNISINLMSFDGENMKEIINFYCYGFPSFAASEFFDIELVDNVFYFVYKNALYAYNSEDKVLKKIAQYIFELDNYSSENWILNANNNIYFVGENKLYKVNNTYEIEVVKFDSSTYFVNKGTFQLKNKIYCINDKSLYEIKSNEALKVFEFQVLSDYHENYIIDKEQNYALFNTGDKYLYHFEDSVIDSMYIGTSYGIRQLGNNFFLIRKSSGTSLLYDGINKKLIEVSDLAYNEFVNDVIVSDIDTFLVVKNTNLTVEIYRAYDNFQELYPFKTFMDNSTLNEPFYDEYGKFGLLYIGKDIYIKDDKNDFYLMDNIFRVTRQNYAKDGYIYFLAADVQYGHQVYRVKMTTNPLSIDDYYVNEIGIYPNPAHDYIQTGKEKWENANYMIFDNLGKLMQSAKHTGKIDISALQNGIYYIMFMRDGQRATGRFLKF